MRVNFAFTSPFTNRLVVGSSIPILLLAVFVIASSFRKYSDRDLKAKQVNLIIRQIGHRLLLQAGDSTSHVPPVTEINEGTFLLKFEKELIFNHDSLIALSRSSFPETDFASGYTVIVNDCIKGDIVYGFEVSSTSPDILACSGRNQPAGLYSIEFSFSDFYENAELQKASVGQLTASTKVNPREETLKSEEIKTTSFDYDIAQRPEASKSIKVASQKADSKLEAFKKTTSSYPSNNQVYISILVVLGLSLLIWRFGRNTKPVSEHNQHNAIIKEPALEGSAHGEFLFDVKGQRLLLRSEVIPLTDKECKILELLHKYFGELVPRETLMQEIWINEGVITGRSLDMFISKLRKKLSTDPQLRITNIHSKGYRLEIVKDAIA